MVFDKKAYQKNYMAARRHGHKTKLEEAEERFNMKIEEITAECETILNPPPGMIAMDYFTLDKKYKALEEYHRKSYRKHAGLQVDYHDYENLSRFGRMYAPIAGTYYATNWEEFLDNKEQKIMGILFKESLTKEVADMINKFYLSEAQMYQVASVPPEQQTALINTFAGANAVESDALQQLKEDLKKFGEIEGVIGSMTKIATHRKKKK